MQAQDTSLTLGQTTIDLGRSRAPLAAVRDRAAALARAHWEVVVLLVVAASVYQPWRMSFLPVADYGIFMVERGTSHSLLAQFLGIGSYYAAQGQLYLFEYFQMTIGGALFGFWAPGWYLSYFVLMSAIMILARNVFLVTGANRTASFIAVAFWATMAPNVEGWIMPTAEPVAILFFLVAVRFAVNYCDSEDWKARALVIAGCIGGVVLAKAVLVSLAPAVWIMSRLRKDESGWQWESWSERDSFLLMSIGASLIVALMPVLLVSHGLDLSAPVWKVTAERLEITLVPATPRLRRLVNILVDPGFTLLLTLPSLLWIRLVIGGMVEGSRRKILWPLIIFLVWVGAGLAVYVPVPVRAGYFMLPFTLGTMFLAAHSFTFLLQRSAGARRVCIGVSLILLTATSLEARTILYQHQQRAQLNSELIDKIAQLGGAEHLIAATRTPSAGRAGWASHLMGFGSAANILRAGDAQDMSCADAKRALLTMPGTVVVSAPAACGKLSPNTEYVSSIVPEWQWPLLWRPSRIEGRMYVARYQPPISRAATK